MQRNRILFHQASQCPRRALVPQLMRPGSNFMHINQFKSKCTQFKQQSTRYTDRKLSKRADFLRWGEECVKKMGGDNVAEVGSNQSGTCKLRREAEWISKRVRHVFPTPIKHNKQTTKENIDCLRCCGCGGKLEGGVY